MSLDDRIRLQIGGMVIQLLALQEEKEQLQAELAARPVPPTKKSKPE